MCTAAKERSSRAPVQCLRANNTSLLLNVIVQIINALSVQVVAVHGEMTEVNKLCGININSSSVLSQGESVKYFLDNLDKLCKPVSCFCLLLLLCSVLYII